ncbi:DUF6090 family protein [Marinoscillum pacificum]|uniref:DUF6090 family protein n=1 Tax=Marinoscillum pacificum TaxID=392723 RepID=UPI00215705CA|nr:DUF6090 family protein [Marinoscillum pacificum]
MKKINWPDHLTNLLVVILGITIAFYLEGWKESKKSYKLEQQYLSSLATDLHSDRIYLDTLLVINRSMEKSLNILTGATIGKAYNEDSLLFHVYSTQYIPPFQPQSVTYESLKSTGNLDLIKDFELRNRIVELYEQFYRGSKEYDKALTNHTDSYVQPYFIRNLDFIDGGRVKTDFLKDKEVRNMLFAEKSIAQMRTTFYKSLDSQLDSLIIQVDRAIEK